MDSLTQIVLGGAVAAAIAPARHRRAALLAGAALGTLPDLDVIPVSLLLDDPIARMTWHRGPSHSLLVLPVLAWLIWAFFKRRGGRVAEAPRRWGWAIALALLTHPLLDAFTVYGTQLWWPLPASPSMWSSIFIIDPVYTVWLLLACGAAWFLRERRAAQAALLAGLVLSTAYLGWSLLAKADIDRAARQALAVAGLQDAPRFSVPAHAGTRRWRVVAMTPDGYLEGHREVGEDGPMAFSVHRIDQGALATAREHAPVQRFAWFNSGFMAAEVRGDALVVSDLRMGRPPDYTFRFVVARRTGDRWQPVTPVAVERQRGREGLGRLWRMLRGDAAPATRAPTPRPTPQAGQAASGTPAINASK